MTAIEHEACRIDPLGAAAIDQYDRLVAEIYQLLTDEQTLRFLPEKKLRSPDAARDWLHAAVLNFHAGRNQVHLIRSKNTGALLGVIDLIPPVVAREYYQLSDYPFFIEFYLKGHIRGKSLMSRLLPKVLAKLQQEGVRELCAVVNRQNLAAGKVLKNAGFRHAGSFDPVQDIYRYVPADEKA